MESKTKIFGHPAHTILIVFPLGLLATAAIFDTLALGSKDETKKRKLSETSQHLLGAGIIGELIAAPFGTRDYLAIPDDTRAKRIGKAHGLGNVLALKLFALSWLSRKDDPANPSKKALALSFAGAAVSGFTGWLGGELVDRLGVGVDDGAHLNAPSSLSRRTANENDFGIF